METTLSRDNGGVGDISRDAASNSPSNASSDTDITAPEGGGDAPQKLHSVSGHTNGSARKLPSLGSIDDLWHAHLDPLDAATATRCQTAAESEGWKRFQHVKPTLDQALRKAHSTASCLRCPPWYNASWYPSPAAIYIWRKDLATHFSLSMSSPAEILSFKYLVRTRWTSPSIQDRIIFAQYLFEERRDRQQALVRRDVSPERPTVMGIFSGVAEAETEHPSPSSDDDDDGSGKDDGSLCSIRNRKAFPTEFYIERSRFQEQWVKWCRMHGSNAQNDLYDFADFASHNPHSMYHKVKYGEWGSPHPYVPFAITNPTEFQNSRNDQEAQEKAAIEWISTRRRVASTQQQLDERGATLRATKPSPPSSEASKAVSLANPPTIAAVPDEVVIDQEVEQPQTLGEQAANAPTPQAQPQPPPTAAVGVAAATSHTNPITVSVIVPDNLMPWIRNHVYAQLKRTADPALLQYWLDDSQRHLPWPGKSEVSSLPSMSAPRLSPVVNIAAVVTDDELPWRSPDSFTGVAPSFRYPNDVEYSASRGLSGPTSVGPRWSSRRPRENDAEAPSSFRLGNLFLSSCPGKKVRLTGAVRGRGAVCRDLSIDLKRFKDLGVGTLVCCLSDAELGVIGVKWEEYLAEADKLGLDIMRIPMVEGNCPTSNANLDAWLTEIITHCTLKGINILVHCRGGVGRAGLVAACWLIKMGFVDEHRPQAERALRGSMWPEGEVMWQALQVVRLRRSSKAIETAEQAAFIARFAEYVLEKSRGGAGSLTTEHTTLVDEYWKRIRMETGLWLQREEARANGSGSSSSDLDGVATPPLDQAATTNGHHSNINSRHAAQIKPVVAATAAAAAAATPVIKSADGQSQTQTPTDSATATSSAVDAASVERGDDGEPCRKRRNTVSSSPTTAAATTAAVRGGGGVEQDEMELDALPVTGREE